MARLAPSVLIDVLTSLGALTGVARSSVIYAIVSASHVLGIALLVGPILLVALSLTGLVSVFDRNAIAALRITARVGAALAVTTGVLLFSARPADYVQNPTMLIKLAVVAIALAHAVLIEIASRSVGGLDQLSREAQWRAGAASALLWLSALGLGRWIAFT